MIVIWVSFHLALPSFLTFLRVLRCYVACIQVPLMKKVLPYLRAARYDFRDSIHGFAAQISQLDWLISSKYSIHLALGWAAVLTLNLSFSDFCLSSLAVLLLIRLLDIGICVAQAQTLANLRTNGLGRITTSEHGSTCLDLARPEFPSVLANHCLCYLDVVDLCCLMRVNRAWYSRLSTRSLWVVIRKTNVALQQQGDIPLLLQRLEAAATEPLDRDIKAACLTVHHELERALDEDDDDDPADRVSHRAFVLSVIFSLVNPLLFVFRINLMWLASLWLSCHLSPFVVAHLILFQNLIPPLIPGFYWPLQAYLLAFSVVRALAQERLPASELSVLSVLAWLCALLFVRRKRRMLVNLVALVHCALLLLPPADPAALSIVADSWDVSLVLLTIFLLTRFGYVIDAAPSSKLAMYMLGFAASLGVLILDSFMFSSTQCSVRLLALLLVYLSRVIPLGISLALPIVYWKQSPFRTLIVCVYPAVLTVGALWERVCRWLQLSSWFTVNDLAFEPSPLWNDLLAWVLLALASLAPLLLCLPLTRSLHRLLLRCGYGVPRVLLDEGFEGRSYAGLAVAYIGAWVVKVNLSDPIMVPVPLSATTGTPTFSLASELTLLLPVYILTLASMAFAFALFLLESSLLGRPAQVAARRQTGLVVLLISLFVMGISVLGVSPAMRTLPSNAARCVLLLLNLQHLFGATIEMDWLLRSYLAGVQWTHHETLARVRQVACVCLARLLTWFGLELVLYAFAIPSLVPWAHHDDFMVCRVHHNDFRIVVLPLWLWCARTLPSLLFLSSPDFPVLLFCVSPFAAGHHTQLAHRISTGALVARSRLHHTRAHQLSVGIGVVSCAVPAVC